MSAPAGANSFGHSYSQPYEPRPPHIPPPLGPWEQLSTPQKYCSSSFSLYWLPVSPQLFHLPHTLKPPLTPFSFVLWSKHPGQFQGGQHRNTAPPPQLQKNIIVAKLSKGIRFKKTSKNQKKPSQNFNHITAAINTMAKWGLFHSLLKNV